MKQDIGKRLLYKFLFKLGSHNNINCVTDFLGRRDTKKMPHITVMRGLIIILAGLATSCSARKQIELELQ